MQRALRILHHEIEPPRACPYLAGKTARLENFLLDRVTEEDLDRLLAAGIRHFGPLFFRPRCDGCVECVSVRVPVDDFRPTRSQRRAWKANQDVRVVVAPPIVDETRLALYRKWHADRERARAWDPAELDEAAYRFSFAHPHDNAREVSYWLGDRLVAVALSDETTSALSAIYCFHDPDERARGLGTFNVLTHLAWAKERGKKHVYLGYWVSGCASLEYKTRFVPQERLRTGASRWTKPDD